MASQLNPRKVRIHNERLVLEKLLLNPALSRADLARLCRISKPSISEIADQLLAKGYIKESGEGDSSGGRKPTLLTIDAAAAAFLTINLAPDKISYMMMNLDGKVLSYRSISLRYGDEIELDELTEADAGAAAAAFTSAERTQESSPGQKLRYVRESVLALLRYLLLAQEHLARRETRGLAAVLISIHGNVAQNEITFTPNYDLKDLPIKQALEQVYRGQVLLENEANLAALGEMGAHVPYRNFALISIHAGVGSGMIVDGCLLSGSNGFGGEIGHGIVEPRGRACPCGNRGCVEQYLSDQSLIRSYAQLVEEAAETQPRKLPPVQTVEELIAYYRAGDELAHTVVESFVFYLAIACNNLLRTIDMDALLFDSKLLRALPELLPRIGQAIRCRIFSRASLGNSRLGADGLLYGGIVQGIKSYLHVEQLRLRQLSGAIKGQGDQPYA